MTDTNAYRTLFGRFSEPEDELTEKWVEEFHERIVEDGETIAVKEWNSGGPGAGAGFDYVYRFGDVFFADSDLGLDGPFQSFTEAAVAINLLDTNNTTESLWIDDKVYPQSEVDDDVEADTDCPF